MEKNKCSVKLWERGFTLIELLVTIAIIGILTAIAIPTYNQYKARAYNARARSDVRNFTIGIEAYWADNEQYPPLNTNLVSNLVPGFVLSPGVEGYTKNNETNPDLYSIGAYHPKGTSTYCYLHGTGWTIINEISSDIAADCPS